MGRALFLFAVIGVWCSQPAEAACSGSGLTWTCTAGTKPGQINSTLGKARDGATLTFAAGDYTWGGGTVIAPSLTKSVTLICEAVGACNVAYSGGFPGTWRPGCCNGGSSSKLYRISGFNFIAPAAGSIWFAWDDSSETTLSHLRIDHNTWTLDDDDWVMQISTITVLYLFGVMDHNTITSSNMQQIPLLYTPAADNTSPLTGRMGTANNLFFEDNVMTATTGGGNGCLDAFGTPAGWVWRFNTVTNCRLTTHGVAHGYGPSNVEYYGNALTYNASATFPDGYRAIHAQGSGTNVFWGNRFTSSRPLSGSAIALLHYFSFTPAGAPRCNGTNPSNGNRTPLEAYLGYPCKHQPGRDLDAMLYPVASFMNVNTSNGANVLLSREGTGGAPYLPDYTTTHLVVNRDYYMSVSANAQTSASSPFDGSVGIGHGTLANRPTTCTTTTEAADAGRGGVMYWATDQGNWNQSASNPYGVNVNGADGVLYMCTATNTWSVYYTPYTYPHPLNSGGGGGASRAIANQASVESQQLLVN